MWSTIGRVSQTITYIIVLVITLFLIAIGWNIAFDKPQGKVVSVNKNQQSMTVGYKTFGGEPKTSTIHNPRNKYNVGDDVRIDISTGQLKSTATGYMMMGFSGLVLGLASWHIYYIYTNEEYARTWGMIDVFSAWTRY